jgi:hypothetical protein
MSFMIRRDVGAARLGHALRRAPVVLPARFLIPGSASAADLLAAHGPAGFVALMRGAGE